MLKTNNGYLYDTKINHKKHLNYERITINPK